MLLDESNIALFAPRFTFCHVGGDTFDAVWRFCCKYMCVTMLCFWTNLILHSFHVILVNLRGGFVDFLSLASCCVLGEYDMAPFAFRFTFDHTGGDTLKQEIVWPLFFAR